MLVTLSGMSIEVRPLQLQKALPPMLVKLAGRSMESRPVSPMKVSVPMLVTLKFSPEYVTVSGIIT